MKLSPEFRVLSSALLLVLLLAGPVFADSKDETLKPLEDETSAPAATTNDATEPATDPELEKKYREELKKRLKQERESYESSLTSLWLANAAVWTVLIAFIIAQAIAARKRANELARLKAMREGE